MEEIGPGHEVGVQNQHELAGRALQPGGQGTRLEAVSGRSAEHRHIHPSPAPEDGALLRQGRGLVGGVVENLDLKAVAGVGQAARRVDQPFHDVLLVVDG